MKYLPFSFKASLVWSVDGDPRTGSHGVGGIDRALCVSPGTGGAHAFAARKGVHAPLAAYEETKRSDPLGKVALPVSVGTMRGAAKEHPVARLSLRILGAGHAVGLARVVAAVGLALNLAALRTLVTKGIQVGHMRLHKRVEER